MIPILYAGNEQNFLNNGLGRLSDAISCKVTEERNGIFELEMTYPITGIHYQDIALNRIILAKTEEGGSNQAFIIYSITRPINGIVTINANHISYLLNGFVVMPFQAVSVADAMSKISQNTVIETPFSFTTDVTSLLSFSFDTPRSIRSLLGGEQGSFLDVFGAYDYRFDNFRVSLLANRGTDNGVVLRYGKNLTELKNLDSTTNIYTGIVPFWKSDTQEVYLTEKVVLSEHASDYPYKIIKTVDFSQEFETAPTQQQLREKAQSYLEANKGWKLKNNIDVSFVALWQSDEYKEVAALERVRMCDTVRVVYSKLGVDITTRVIKTVYNVILEKYDSISLGDSTYNLSQAIQETIMEPEIKKSQSYTKNAVARATKLIQGGLGGHVVFNTNGAGEPQEILIMDTDDITTAVNVIRINLNGIGFSHNGYNGPFNTAWTIDGSFVADYITSGTFDGALIRAGTIQSSSLSVETKEELEIEHNYLPFDAFTNLFRWHEAVYWGTRVRFQTITVEGQSKTALVIDGTDAPEINYVDIYCDVTASPTIHVAFKYQYVNTITVSNTELLKLSGYPKGSEYASGEVIVSLPLGETITGGQEYTIDLDYTFINNYDPYRSVSYKKPCFSFWPEPGEVIYIYDLSITGGEENYKKAVLSYTTDGLNSTVQNGSIISSINQSAENVSISASKINLTGDLSLRGDFHSYNSNDPTTYAFLDDGNLQFALAGDVVFAIASDYDGFSGIVFGNPDDYLTNQYSVIQQNFVKTGNMLAYYNGSVGTGGFGRDDTFISEGTANFYGGIVVDDSVLEDALGTSITNVFNNKTRFNDTVYNQSGGQVFVSDENKKRCIKDLTIEDAKSFIMALKPREFKFKEGISKSDRKHHGFIAQEIKQAMREDWGVYIEDEANDIIGLRYDELLADMVMVLQNQERRIEALERKLNDNTII